MKFYILIALLVVFALCGSATVENVNKEAEIENYEKNKKYEKFLDEDKEDTLKEDATVLKEYYDELKYTLAAFSPTDLSEDETVALNAISENLERMGLKKKEENLWEESAKVKAEIESNKRVIESQERVLSDFSNLKDFLKTVSLEQLSKEQQDQLAKMTTRMETLGLKDQYTPLFETKKVETEEADTLDVQDDEELANIVAKFNELKQRLANIKPAQINDGQAKKLSIAFGKLEELGLVNEKKLESGKLLSRDENDVLSYYKQLQLIMSLLKPEELTKKQNDAAQKVKLEELKEATDSSVLSESRKVLNHFINLEVILSASPAAELNDKQRAALKNVNEIVEDLGRKVQFMESEEKRQVEERKRVLLHYKKLKNVLSDVKAEDLEDHQKEHLKDILSGLQKMGIKHEHEKLFKEAQVTSDDKARLLDMVNSLKEIEEGRTQESKVKDSMSKVQEHVINMIK